MKPKRKVDLLLPPLEWRYLRRRHQITQAAVAEKLGLTVQRVRQFENKTYDPRMSTLVKFRDALLELIAAKEAQEQAEFEAFLRQMENEPDNVELVRRYRKQRAWERGHRVSWVKPKRSAGGSSSGGTTA